jgi:hypothetical protein
MTDIERLKQMVKDLRQLRDKCEPKSNANPRYHRYSNAVSAISWVIADIRAEEGVE